MRRRPSSPEELRAGDVSRSGELPVKTYVLFHHAPGRDDEALRGIEAAAQRMFAGSVVAREGLILSP